ncbi:nuclear transport factor 2 family protein [Pseudomonas oryzihabitans]|uniref:nuclear transport factor 2 family protein n=1 Tax=Pseudomonas TaxID=286 RepID=UPI000D3C7D9D|nr:MULTISPECIES: nuclear transport factor 2 family protein [Pseudomonas]NMZ63559.1 nuclear transport factor 2 family protein [Pseudomonas oryzihabitans]QEU03648.1 nuclear transport factor 2 family protein [Pseudomonas oryzihabitans]RAU42554.1 nuclear transport factor 2 family protein [Pseudomonas sp. RIT 411]
MNPAKRLTGSALLALALLSVLWSGGAAAESTAERNQRLVERAFANWSAGRGSLFDDLLSPTVVWTIRGSGPAAGTYHGREDFLQRAVRPFAQRLATPIVPRVEGIWAREDQVVVRWMGTATARDGAPYRNEYVWIFRMNGARATQVEAFLDLVPYQDVIDRIALAAPSPAMPSAERQAP